MDPQPANNKQKNLLGRDSGSTVRAQWYAWKSIVKAAVLVPSTEKKKYQCGIILPIWFYFVVADHDTVGVTPHEQSAPRGTIVSPLSIYTVTNIGAKLPFSFALEDHCECPQSPLRKRKIT